MTTKDLAAAIGCHPKTIRKLVAERRLDPTIVGGSKGFVFAEDTPEIVREILKDRHHRALRAASRQRKAA